MAHEVGHALGLGEGYENGKDILSGNMMGMSGGGEVGSPGGAEGYNLNGGQIQILIDQVK
jgi:hypothetical protein